MNCRPVSSLMGKLFDRLGQSEAKRLRVICMLLVVGLLVADVVVIRRLGHAPWSVPHYSAIHPVTTIGVERRPEPGKAFSVVWDSLMADPVTKRRWDSLLQLRPGLRDTIRQLDRMDSAAWVW
jgi:hypothetical protein